MTNRSNRLLHVAVTGVDDHERIRRHLLDVVGDLPTRNARHLQIDDRRIEVLLGQHLQRRLAILADRHVVAHARQLDTHHLADRRLVVDKQDSQRRQRRPIDLLLTSVPAVHAFAHSLGSFKAVTQDPP